MQRMLLTQALEDVCSSPAALISVMAGPDNPEGPGSPNRSSPTPTHGFDIERVNQTYKAILQVLAWPDMLCYTASIQGRPKKDNKPSCTCMCSHVFLSSLCVLLGFEAIRVAQ